MDIHSNISFQRLLIGLAGIIIGCISAFSYAIDLLVQEPLAFYAYIFGPGGVFGFAVAVIYFKNAEHKLAWRFGGAVVITVTGFICYPIAFYTTFLITALTNSVAYGGALIIAPVAAAVGGFFVTCLFVSILQAVTKKYSRLDVKFGFYGGLLGALLIDSITYVTNSRINAPDPDFSVVFLSSCIFFVGWQTIMLMIISGPLLKKADNQITNPTAVACGSC